MREDSAERVHERVDAVYRAELRRVLATLIRLLGDFDLAEEALHDAFRTALEQCRAGGHAAPCSGEDNDYMYGELLGMSA
jgi:predicted RNA polymerase sigma factor